MPTAAELEAAGSREVLWQIVDGVPALGVRGVWREIVGQPGRLPSRHARALVTTALVDCSPNPAVVQTIRHVHTHVLGGSAPRRAVPSSIPDVETRVLLLAIVVCLAGLQSAGCI